MTSESPDHHRQLEESYRSLDDYFKVHHQPFIDAYHASRRKDRKMREMLRFLRDMLDEEALSEFAEAITQNYFAEKEKIGKIHCNRYLNDLDLAAELLADVAHDNEIIRKTLYEFQCYQLTCRIAHDDEFNEQWIYAWLQEVVRTGLTQGVE